MQRPGKALLTWKGAPWAGGSLLLVLAAVALFFVTGTASPQPSTAEQAGSGDITYGPEGAPVVLIEYSDFQCEVCARYATILAPLRAKYQDEVLFVFRFFPLDYHANGMASAQAAYAAFRQGTFWEMHDLLFEHQPEWADAADPYANFETYAAELGLDLGRFREDYGAPTTKDFITAQQAEGAEAGVNHTPWFIVNDSVVVPRKAGDFEALIEAAQ